VIYLKIMILALLGFNVFIIFGMLSLCWAMPDQITINYKLSFVLAFWTGLIIGSIICTLISADKSDTRKRVIRGRRMGTRI